MSVQLQRFKNPFNTAFYAGGPVVANFIPNQYQVAIAGHPYIIDPAQYSRSTLPIRRQPMDDSIEPGEQSLSQEGLWRRGQDNNFLGMGQEYLDNRFTFLSVYQRNGENPSIRSRSWHSQGVDVWKEGAVSLLPAQAKIKTSSNHPWVITVATALYYWDGTTLQYCAAPGTGTLTWVSVTTPGGGSWPAVSSPTTDGYHLWMAAGSSGVVVTTLASGSSAYLRPTPTAPTVVVATPAAATYEYWVVGTDINGFKTFVSSPTTITNGNATVNNTVSWAAIPGIVSWDVLRGDTGHSVALGATGLSFVDTVSSPVAGYVVPTATIDNLAADFLSYANGFLIGAAGPLLASVASNGTTELLWTHPNPQFHWRAGAPSPMAIYLAGDAGGNSEIFATTLDSTTDGLSAPYLAGQVGNGELVRAMAYYEGLMMLGTSLGIRTAQDTQSNGHLTTGPVITDPGDVLCLGCFGPFCWFGWSNYDTDDGIQPTPTVTAGTGRLSLSNFTTDPLVPAYAPDVAATLGTTGLTTSIAIVDGLVFFTVDGTGGLWGPDGDVVPSGFIETGWIRYGLIQAKVLVALDIRHEPLAGSIAIECVPAGDVTFLIGVSSVPSSIGPGVSFNAGNRTMDAFQLLFTLSRDADDATQGPIMHSWTSEALPVVTRQDQIIVPIMMGQTVISPVRNGEEVTMDPLAEFQYLKSLEASSIPIIYQEGSAAYTCIIDEIEIKAKEWTDDFSFFQGLMLVKLLSLDVDI